MCASLFDLDFNTADPADHVQSEEEFFAELKERNKAKRRHYCGRPVYWTNPATGNLEVKYVQRCKQYSQCEKCRAWKEELEKKRINRIANSDKTVKYVEVDQSEEKKLARKYYGDYRRIPLENGKTGFIIQTEDDIPDSQPLTREIALKLVKNVVTEEDGRRPSGRLGNDDFEPIVQLEKEEKKEEEESKTELEKFDFNTAHPSDYYHEVIKVSVQEMDIEFDSDNPDAPQDKDELMTIAQAEVDLTEHPYDKPTLQKSIRKLEYTIKRVCKRFGMSFSFYNKSLLHVDLYDVDWEWLKKRLET